MCLERGQRVVATAGTDTGWGQGVDTPSASVGKLSTRSAMALTGLRSWLPRADLPPFAPTFVNMIGSFGGSEPLDPLKIPKSSR